MPWSDWVSTPEAHARASARREEVRQLLQRWGLTPATRVKLARRFKVNISTINRDVRALQERPLLPIICPTCGLPRAWISIPRRWMTLSNWRCWSRPSPG